jgi:hypothetical protein
MGHSDQFFKLQDAIAFPITICEFRAEVGQINIGTKSPDEMLFAVLTVSATTLADESDRISRIVPEADPLGHAV